MLRTKLPTASCKTRWSTANGAAVVLIVSDLKDAQKRLLYALEICIESELCEG